MTIKKFTYHCLCVTVLLFLQGCAVQKHTATQSQADKQRQITLQHILDAQPDFQSAEVGRMRFTLNYADRQMTANGSLKFIKDSILVVSLQPVMGIELFRAEITPAHLTVVDKMNRRYARFTFPELSEYVGIPVTFPHIQALAMQHVFTFGNGKDWKQCAYTLNKADGQHCLSFDDNGISYTFLFDAVNYMLGETRLVPGKMNASASVSYRNEEQTDGILFPSVVEISYMQPNHEATLLMTMIRRQFNKEVNLSPVNLKNYKLVDISTILP